MGTNVTIIEYLDRIVPVEDKEISKALEKSLKKKGINIRLNSEATYENFEEDTIGRPV